MQETNFSKSNLERKSNAYGASGKSSQHKRNRSTITPSHAKASTSHHRATSNYKSHGDSKQRLHPSQWLGRNVVAALMAFAIFTIVVRSNEFYHWLWFDFTANNLENMAIDKHESLVNRLTKRIGPDYAFVESIKNMTPENAIIYYPSRDDFKAPPPYEPFIQFRGTMGDKLSAVRVLYPRRVVTEDEMGHTPYSKRLTHVAIVNGRNLDLVQYPTNPNTNIDVLPIRLPSNQSR